MIFNHGDTERKRDRTRRATAKDAERTLRGFSHQGTKNTKVRAETESDHEDTKKTIVKKRNQSKHQDTKDSRQGVRGFRGSSARTMNEPTMNDERIPAGYVLVLWNRRKRGMRVGALGRIEFEPGFYLYVGSGGANPVKRVQRHLRPDKPVRWHIDYLTTGPRRMRAVDAFLFPGKQECELADVLARRLAVVPRFGSSDCRCRGHLFHCPGVRELERALEAVGPMPVSRSGSRAW